MRVGIVGSSQIKATNSNTYNIAVREVKDELDALNVPYNEIELISGGSSWADHIAITLYQLLKSEGIKLCLFLPCELTTNNLLIGSFTMKSYFGRELNKRHKAFSEICFSSNDASLNELFSISSESNVKIVVDRKGFKSRNSLIASNVDYLLAISNTETVSGGTKDTWEKCDKINKKLLHFK